MQIVLHRRNTAAQLADIPRAFGVEIDIRTRGPELILHHDPYAEGEPFAEWLRHYEHRLLILNVKEEGLEESVLRLMAVHGIEAFFFLDQSVPFLVKTARGGERRCAVRVSEYESVETAMRLEGLVDWLWLDSFTGALPSAAELGILAASAFEVCLVSPELQGRDPTVEVPAMRKALASAGLAAAAVCTKVPALWS